MKKMIKYIARISVAAIVIFMVIDLTTFGWRLNSHSKINSTQESMDIANHLKITITSLANNIGFRNFFYYKNLKKAEEYIHHSFEGMGYVVQEVSYKSRGHIFKNIFVETQGDIKNGVIIVGAHYDSCFNPGADDNASGIAGVLELAKMFKGIPLKHKIIFVAFVNEEPPYFQTAKMGSYVLARSLKEQGVKVKAAIVLEMIGFYSDRFNSQRYLPLLGPFYPNKGNFLTVIGNFSSRYIVNSIKDKFKESSQVPLEAFIAPEWVPGVGFSDHWSFWQNQYPAVMVTDTAYLRNKNYHRFSDRASTLNYEMMANVILGLKQSINGLSVN